MRGWPLLFGYLAGAALTYIETNYPISPSNLYRNNEQRLKEEREMSDKKQIPQVPLMLSVPQEIRDLLRIMAAKEILKNPDQVTSAAQIGRKIICEFLADMQPE